MSVKRPITQSFTLTPNSQKRQKHSDVIEHSSFDADSDESDSIDTPPLLESELLQDPPHTPATDRLIKTPKSHFSFAEAKRRHSDKLRSIDRVLPPGDRSLSQDQPDFMRLTGSKPDHYLDVYSPLPLSVPSGPASFAPKSLRSPLRFASPPGFFSSNPSTPPPEYSSANARWTKYEWKLLYGYLHELQLENVDQEEIERILPDWVYIQFPNFTRSEVQLRALAIIKGGLEHTRSEHNTYYHN